MGFCVQHAVPPLSFETVLGQMFPGACSGKYQQSHSIAVAPYSHKALQYQESDYNPIQIRWPSFLIQLFLPSSFATCRTTFLSCSLWTDPALEYPVSPHTYPAEVQYVFKE